MPPAIAIMLVYGLSKRQFSTKVTLAGWMVGATIAIAIKLTGGSFHLAIGAAVGLLVLFLGSSWVQPEKVKSPTG